MAGTGYAPDLARLEFVDADLRAEIRLAGGAPALDRGFQSSAPGLYFAGYSAAASFGPVMRFVFGTGFAAPRLARELAPLRATRAGVRATADDARRKASTARDLLANARATVSVAVSPPPSGATPSGDTPAAPPPAAPPNGRTPDEPARAGDEPPAGALPGPTGA